MRPPDSIARCFHEKGLENISLYRNAGQKYVFTAEHPQYGTVVLKVIKPEQDLERIKREIQILKDCQGFNTSTIYEDGEINFEGESFFYIIEAFIDGMNLRQYLIENKTLSYHEVYELLSSILNAIQLLEQRKLVHRDIKPENIMRAQDGNYYLIDFGIARDLSRDSLTDTENRFGPHTAGYAPIEQINNEKENIDSRVDLYSLAVIAYEGLTGSNPFLEDCQNIIQVIRKIEKGSFNHLDDNEHDELNEFIHACMNRYRTRRPSTAADARDWFQAILNKYKLRG